MSATSPTRLIHPRPSSGARPAAIDKTSNDVIYRSNGPQRSATPCTETALFQLGNVNHGIGPACPLSVAAGRGNWQRWLTTRYVRTTGRPSKAGSYFSRASHPSLRNLRLFLLGAATALRMSCSVSVHRYEGQYSKPLSQRDSGQASQAVNFREVVSRHAHRDLSKSFSN